MGWHNKVVWSEGLFLRPQVFQQQERYFENFINQRTLPLGSFFWGFSQYEIDYDSLSFGKLVLKSAIGVFRDGTPFDVPGSTPPPPPLSILPEHQDQLIYLAAPLRLPNTDETSFEKHDNSLARYAAFDTELRDSNSINRGSKPIQLANLRLSLLPKKDLNESWLGLEIARIGSINTDGSATLHLNDYIPVISNYSSNTLLLDWITQLNGLTKLRANDLARRLSGSDGKVKETAEVADYLLLQILNRYDPLLDHINHTKQMPPAEVYRHLAMFAGELATFVSPKTRRPETAPGYDHLNLFQSIKPLIDELHELLNQVLVRGAQSIPLLDQSNGIHIANILPNELAGYSALVLAVSAQMPAEMLKLQFAAQTKVSPPERLSELIRSHLPGLNLQPLPVPPRQIPFNTEYVYFEIVQNGPFWGQVAKHGGLAMHIAGSFPALQMELWGVRQK